MIACIAVTCFVLISNVLYDTIFTEEQHWIDAQVLIALSSCGFKLAVMEAHTAEINNIPTPVYMDMCAESWN